MNYNVESLSREIYMLMQYLFGKKMQDKTHNRMVGQASDP